MLENRKEREGGGGQGRNQHNNARVRMTTKTTKEEGPAPIVIKYISRPRVEQTTDTLWLITMAHHDDSSR